LSRQIAATNHGPLQFFAVNGEFGFGRPITM